LNLPVYNAFITIGSVKNAEIQNEQYTTVISHSFGGILAKTALAELPAHTVTQFVTMASPHGLNYGGVHTTKEYLQTPLTVTVPTLLSFGGSLDPVVPDTLSMLPNAKHTTIACEHMAFLHSATVRTQVLQSLF
jgi:hypothetical protein